MRFSDYVSRHFQLRMKRFYARLCYNPWRKNIIYLGDPAEMPTLGEEKSLYWAATATGIMHERAFTLWVSSYDELPFGDDSIDVIVCNFSQMGESASFLMECHRVLRSEGKLVWTIRNPYSPHYAFETKGPSAMEARRLLRDYDFDVLSVKAHSFLPRWGGKGVARMLLRWESWLLKNLPFLANRISFIAIKQTAHYSPLPSYLRLSHRLLWENPCQL